MKLTKLGLLMLNLMGFNMPIFYYVFHRFQIETIDGLGFSMMAGPWACWFYDAVCYYVGIEMTNQWILFSAHIFCNHGK